MSKAKEDKWYPGKLFKERRASRVAAKAAASGRGPAQTLGGVAEDVRESADRISSTENRRRGYGPEKSVGQVIVKIIDTRYAPVTKPSLEVLAAY